MELFEQLCAAVMDRTVTDENTIAEGDTVAIRVTWNATRDGAYQGIEPIGNESELSVIEFHRWGDGKTTERRISSVQLVLMQQPGVVDPPSG